MADLSDYLESGLINHVFRGGTFAKPGNITIALTSGEIPDNATGATLPELPYRYSNGTLSGYDRINLGDPAISGNVNWKFDADVYAASGGVIKNCFQLIWDSAAQESAGSSYGWGWVSGIAIVDDNDIGEGNVLMKATLDNPREVFAGDTLLFNSEQLIISFK